MKQLWLLISLLLISCTTPVSTNQDFLTPASTNQDFLYAALDCTPLLVEWSDAMKQSGSRKTLCKGNDMQSALDKLERCWANVPEPPDKNLKQSRADMKRAIEKHQSSLAELRRFCNGNGSLELALSELQGATRLTQSATENLNKYVPGGE